MPLKQEIIPHLSFLSPEATDGVNTVVVKDDKLYGYSTDAQGFHASLQQIGADYKGADIVMIGAGAVTKLLDVYKRQLRLQFQYLMYFGPAFYP